MKKDKLSYQNKISIEKVKEKATLIVKNFNPLKIILFGSIANDSQNQYSDADLLVILESNKSNIDLGVEISTSLKHDIPMDIIVKTPEQINKRLEIGDYFFQSIFREGITLYERNTERMD